MASPRQHLLLPSPSSTPSFVLGSQLSAFLTGCTVVLAPCLLSKLHSQRRRRREIGYGKSGPSKWWDGTVGAVSSDDETERMEAGQRGRLMVALANFHTGPDESSLLSPPLAVRVIGLSGSLANWLVLFTLSTFLLLPLRRALQASQNRTSPISNDLPNSPSFAQENPRLLCTAVLALYYVAYTAPTLFWLFVPVGKAPRTGVETDHAGNGRGWVWWLVLPAGDIAMLSLLLTLLFLPALASSPNQSPLPLLRSPISPYRGSQAHLPTENVPPTLPRLSVLGAPVDEITAAGEEWETGRLPLESATASEDRGSDSAGAQHLLERGQSLSMSAEQGVGQEILTADGRAEGDEPNSRWSNDTGSASYKAKLKKQERWQQRQEGMSGIRRLFFGGAANKPEVEKPEETVKRQVRFASSAAAPPPQRTTYEIATENTNRLNRIGMAVETPPPFRPPSRDVRLGASPPPLPGFPPPSLALPTVPAAASSPGFRSLGPTPQRLALEETIQQDRIVPVPPPQFQPPPQTLRYVPAAEIQQLRRQASQASSASAYSTATSHALSRSHSRASSSISRSGGSTHPHPRTRGEIVFPPQFVPSRSPTRPDSREQDSQSRAQFLPYLMGESPSPVPEAQGFAEEKGLDLAC
ncbi:hypothetical protein JCM11641_005708 [Rhodosporidiobolus odoratus]